MEKRCSFTEMPGDSSRVRAKWERTPPFYCSSRRSKASRRGMEWIRKGALIAIVRCKSPKCIEIKNPLQCILLFILPPDPHHRGAWPCRWRKSRTAWVGTLSRWLEDPLQGLSLNCPVGTAQPVDWCLAKPGAMVGHLRSPGAMVSHERRGLGGSAQKDPSQMHPNASSFPAVL